MSDTSALPGDGPPPGGAEPPFGGWTPPPGTGGLPRPAVLRRSREDRVAVGLAGGLGRYFNVDPVIFRVSFGVLALFGGSGIVLYLLGWAAVPDEGTAAAPIDRAIAGLRRRRIPVSVVLIVALLLIWAVFFSWWSPFSFVPTIALIGVLALFLVRGGRPIRIGEPVSNPPAATAVAPGSTAVPPGTSAAAPGWSPPGAPPPAGTPAPGVADPGTSGTDPNATSATTQFAQPASAGLIQQSELRAWFRESRDRARERQRRRRPVTVAAFVLLVATLVTLALIDVTTAIPFASYFIAIGAISLLALVIGGALRRTPWSLAPLLIPAVIGLFVFGTSSVSAHDGWGDRAWTPVASGGIDAHYRIAFGRGTLDLTGLPAPKSTASTHIVMGAGELRIIVPRTLPVIVENDVHTGNVSVDGNDLDNGVNFNDTYRSPAAAARPGAIAVVVHVKLASGHVAIITR